MFPAVVGPDTYVHVIELSASGSPKSFKSDANSVDVARLGLGNLFFLSFFL